VAPLLLKETGASFEPTEMEEASEVPEQLSSH
jgi:hypothetical protein